MLTKLYNLLSKQMHGAPVKRLSGSKNNSGVVNRERQPARNNESFGPSSGLVYSIPLGVAISALSP